MKSKKHKNTALIKRKLLRNPISVIITFILFITSASLLASESFLYGFYFWQVPTQFAAWLSASVVTIFGTYATFLASRATFGKNKLHTKLRRAFRHGHPTILFAFTSSIMIASSIFAHYRHVDHIAELYARLESHPSIYGDLESEVDAFLKKPKFSTNSDIKFIKQVIHFRKKGVASDSWSVKEYSEWAVSFSEDNTNSSPKRRAWSYCLSADCYAGMRYIPKAKALYLKAAEQKGADYVQRLALGSLGDLSYFEGDLDAAVKYWSSANAIKEMRGTTENIAWAYAKEEKWDIAFEQMNRARELIAELEKKPKQELLAARFKAQNHVQMARLHRMHAKKLPPTDAQKELKIANDELLSSNKEFPGLLDQYWTGVLINLDKGDKDDCTHWISLFKKNLSDKRVDLNLLNYKEFAESYMLWMEIRASVRFKNIISEDILSRLDLIQIDSSSREQKIYRILQNTEKNYVVIDEDIDTLFEMISSGILHHPKQASH